MSHEKLLLLLLLFTFIVPPLVGGLPGHPREVSGQAAQVRQVTQHCHVCVVNTSSSSGGGGGTVSQLACCWEYNSVTCICAGTGKTGH
jgi:hypothetical protein